MLNKEDFIKKLGLIIREARKSKALSIEELAHNCDIAYSTLSCLERGVVGNLQVYNLYKLIIELDITPSLIFKEIEDSSKNKEKIIDKISSLKNDELDAVLELLRRVVV